MDKINVTGLPEAVVRALEGMVETLRRQMTSSTEPAGPKDRGPASNGMLRLDKRPGKVIGHLTREEIYDDAE